MTQLKRWQRIRFIWMLMLNFIAIFAYGQDGPKISFSEKGWDIGTIKMGEEKIRKFKVKNIGSDELEITQIRSSCRCLKVNINSKKIQPNGYAEIKATFNEYRRLGKVIKTIYIDSNDPTAPRSILRVKARPCCPTPMATSETRPNAPSTSPTFVENATSSVSKTA